MCDDINFYLNCGNVTFKSSMKMSSIALHFMLWKMFNFLVTEKSFNQYHQTFAKDKLICHYLTFFLNKLHSLMA